MSTTETTAVEGESTEATDQQVQDQETTFTQADVDRIVKERAERIAKQRFADYDDLKAKAGAASTAEERLAALEQELTSTKTEALRAKVAGRYGISAEPGEDGKSDADLFLTGTDEDTLIAQAKRLSERESERKKNGNVAPREGNSPAKAAAASPWSGALQAMDQARA